MNKKLHMSLPIIAILVCGFSLICHLTFEGLLPIVYASLSIILLVEILYQGQLLPAQILVALKRFHDTHNSEKNIRKNQKEAEPETSLQDEISGFDFSEIQNENYGSVDDLFESKDEPEIEDDLKEDDFEEDIYADIDLGDDGVVAMDIDDDDEDPEVENKFLPFTAKQKIQKLRDQDPDVPDWVSGLEAEHDLVILIDEHEAGQIFEIDEDIIAGVQESFSKRNTTIFEQVRFITDGDSLEVTDWELERTEK